MKLSIKKAILVTSFLGTLFVFLLLILGTNWCYSDELCRSVRHTLGGYDWLEVTILFPLIFLFSLITYRMKEEVFQSWFKFAVWYVPAIVIGYLLYPGGGNNSLGVVSGAYGDMFDMLIYIVAVSIFVIVSIVRILKARKRARG